MLDHRDAQGALLVDAGLALFHLRQPLGRRLHRKVRSIVREIEKKRRRQFRPFAQIIARPAGEQLRGMACRRDDLAVAAHVVVPLPEVGRVAVHHIVEEAVEKIEAAVVGQRRRRKAEVPLADDRGVIAGGAEVIGERGHRGIEIAPGVVGVGADETGHADAIRVAAAHQRRARGRAHRRIGPHPGETHPLGGEPIKVRCPHIGVGPVRRNVPNPKIVGQDHQDVGLRFRGRGKPGCSDGKDEPDNADQHGEKRPRRRKLVTAETVAALPAQRLR